MSFRLKELSQAVCLEQSGTGRENLKLISFSFISFVIFCGQHLRIFAFFMQCNRLNFSRIFSVVNGFVRVQIFADLVNEAGKNGRVIFSTVFI